MSQEEIQEQKPQKSQREILKSTEEAALTELERGTKGLLLSSFSAGLDIGFSVLLMAVVFTLFSQGNSSSTVHVLVSLMYPLGFIFVILGRSELFTEHTTLAVLPVLQRLSSVKKLLRLWLLVFVGNIIGGTLFAYILSFLANKIHLVAPTALNDIADKLTNLGWQSTLLTAMLAGWLMGLLAWLVAAARETISQIMLIIIVTAVIGICGLPHCIVGNIECAAGLFNGHVIFEDYIKFLSFATLGNILGGVFFVAVLKYNHTMFSGKHQEVEMKVLEEKENNEFDEEKLT